MQEQNIIFETEIMEEQVTISSIKEIAALDVEETDVEELINRIVQVYHLL